MFSFGSGSAHATPLTSAVGAAIANPTPTEFGTLQDISVDFGFDVKELFGRKQFAVDMARGKGKITGKAKAARMNGTLLNNIMFGQTMTTGAITAVTTSNTPTTVATTVTITPPNTGTFVADLGVTNAVGAPYSRVASAPVAGQYSVDAATGIYTFAAADVGVPVFINYSYNATVTGSKKIVVQNLDMGDAPTFSLTFHTAYKGKILSITLNRCISSKMALATKQDDYTIPDFEFQAFADDLGNVVTFNLSE
ncbi:MAG: hypothetical protein RLY58_2312 [Pseudomonadota bacterium]|jgi:hypothetical protein